MKDFRFGVHEFICVSIGMVWHGYTKPLVTYIRLFRLIDNPASIGMVKRLYSAMENSSMKDTCISSWKYRWWFRKSLEDFGKKSGIWFWFHPGPGMFILGIVTSPKRPKEVGFREFPMISAIFKGKSGVPMGEYPRYIPTYHLYMGYIIDLCGNMV